MAPSATIYNNWDEAIVTAFLKALGDNDKLHINDLTQKTTMLMALTRPSRSTDLAGLGWIRGGTALKG